MTTRNIPVGSGSNNECCVCGGLGNQTDSAGVQCSGSCTQFNNTIGTLYGDNPGTNDVPCFPQTCCPCPPMGGDGEHAGTRSVILNLTTNVGGETCALGGLNQDITLTHTDGIPICTGGTIEGGGATCYAGTETVRERGLNAPMEKYGKKDHIFPTIPGDEGGSCSGVKADISLCCCHAIGSNVKMGVAGECHTCNYHLTIDFKPFETSPDYKYCHCPSGYVGGDDPTQLKMPILLGQNHEPADSSAQHDFSAFTLVHGQCDPFILEYEAEDLYWNCGPCMNGEEEGVDNTVKISATITEAP